MKFVEARRTTLNKLQIGAADAVGKRDNYAEITALVKVTEEDYIPSGIDVRAKLAPKLFTAKMHRADLERLDKDPRVVSIETGRRLRLIN